MEVRPFIKEMQVIFAEQGHIDGLLCRTRGFRHHVTSFIQLMQRVTIPQLEPAEHSDCLAPHRKVPYPLISRVSTRPWSGISTQSGRLFSSYPSSYMAFSTRNASSKTRTSPSSRGQNRAPVAMLR